MITGLAIALVGIAASVATGYLKPPPATTTAPTVQSTRR